MFILVIIRLSQNTAMISNKLGIGKMKDETSGVVIEEFVRLKPKMYSFLVDNNTEHKKAKGMNRNVDATISHNEYKDVFLNNKCIRHSVNRIQSKGHRIGTYMKSTKFHYLALMTKYISKTSDLMD